MGFKWVCTFHMLHTAVPQPHMHLFMLPQPYSPAVLLLACAIYCACVQSLCGWLTWLPVWWPLLLLFSDSLAALVGCVGDSCNKAHCQCPLQHKVGCGWFLLWALF